MPRDPDGLNLRDYQVKAIQLCSQRGISTEAVLKITAKAGAGDPRKVRERIRRFKNERYPGIAVTVDLLTTGIDVPEITALVFLRRVKSRILFEQMLGRGTRLCPEIRKTHFEIYDPVGVYEALDPLSNMKPVAVNPSATFFQLLDGLSVMESAEQTASQVEQIVAKLQRKKRNLNIETAEFVRENRDEIAALNIVCTRPRELTRESLKSLRMALDRAGFTERHLSAALSQTTNRDMAADIISLIRRYAVGSTLVNHETRIRNAVERLRQAHSFTRQELDWLDRIEKYLLEECVLTAEAFDEDSRFQAQGGFARINKIFRSRLSSLIVELNDYLYDDGGMSA